MASTNHSNHSNNSTGGNRQAIELNNLGVDAFEAGNVVKAMRYFSRAVRLSKHKPAADAAAASTPVAAPTVATTATAAPVQDSISSRTRRRTQQRMQPATTIANDVGSGSCGTEKPTFRYRWIECRAEYQQDDEQTRTCMIGDHQSQVKMMRKRKMATHASDASLPIDAASSSSSTNSNKRQRVLITCLPVSSPASQTESSPAETGVAAAPTNDSNIGINKTNPSTPLGCKNTSSPDSTFLIVRTLKILVPAAEGDDALDGCCPCTFAWAIWYNLSLALAVMGFHFNQSTSGRRFLLCKSANILQHIEQRIRNDPKPTTKEWFLLLLVISNTLSCIARELAMMETATYHLNRMTTLLQQANGVIHETIASKTLHPFVLNVKILSRMNSAPSA